jgi:hypothetical protein
MNAFFTYLVSGLPAFVQQTVKTLEPAVLTALENALTEVLAHVRTAKNSE